MSEENKVPETLETPLEIIEEVTDDIVEAITEEVIEDAIEEAIEEIVESMEDYEEELTASMRTIQEGDILTGTVIGTSDTEVVLDLKYYTDGIIRLEDLSGDPSFSIREHISIGQIIRGTVIRKDDGQGHILLSSKEANDVLSWARLTELMEDRTVLTLKVQGIVKSGVIVYVEGIRGFIPASQLSLTYVEELESYLLKEIQARIITVDEEDKRLVLSAKDVLKELEQEEQKTKISNIEVGLVTEGKVDSIQPYGAFVSLDNGVSGLVHISQICEKRIKSPAAILSVGDIVKVKVIGIKDGKVSLSMKALLDVTSQEIQEEEIDIPVVEELSTNLGSLLENFKF
jgi:Ribosomal protein S1